MARGPTISTTFNAIDKVSKPMQRMARNVTRIAAVAGTAIVAGLGAGIAFAVREASKIEDAVAGFTPLLGGIEKANELVGMLNKTAATTPFQFEAISKAAKQLLPVMNQDIERTVATFRMLGDTAGGNAQKLESITRGFTKAMLKGKVDMESLNMIAEAGVPIYTELADSMGVSVQEMMDLSRVGKISSSDLEDAFRNMTKEGGIFFRGMEIASKTLTGKFSTLKDNIALTAAGIGKTLLPVIKQYVDIAITAAGSMREWVINNEDLIKVKLDQAIKKIIKVATTLWKLWDSGLIPAMLAAIVAFKILFPLVTTLVGLYKLWAAAQLTLNGLMAANIVGLIVLGIAALIAVTIIIIKNWDRFVEIVKAVWKWLTKVYDAIKPLILIFGAMVAPLVFIIDMIRSLVRNFGDIKAAFQDGGFLSGILEIGKALLEGVLKPLQSIWELIMKVKDFIKSGASKFADFASRNVDPSQQMGTSPDNPFLIGKNAGIVNSQVLSGNASIDVNINGAPPNSTARQTGNIPQITLNTGFNGSGL